MPTSTDDPSVVTSTQQNLNASDQVNELMAAMYDETAQFERIVSVIIPTLFVIVIIVGLFGNCLVVLVVLLNRQMQNSTNTLIINLAMADLLFILFCVPFTAADYALPIWAFSREWCKIMQYLQSVSAYASVWTLVLMSVDRFLAVVFPVKSLTLRTVKRTTAMVAVLWLVILLANLPNLWIYDVFHYVFVKQHRSVCVFIRQATQTGTDAEVRGWFFSFNAFGYVIPLGFTSVLYVFLLWRLWRGNRPSGHKSGEANRAKRKVTWMVTGIIVTFAVCWLPLNVCFFMVAYDYEQGVMPKLSKTSFLVQVGSQVLAYSNSCLNPILYAFLSDNFRKAFKQFLKRCMFVNCCTFWRYTGLDTDRSARTIPTFWNSSKVEIALTRDGKVMKDACSEQIKESRSMAPLKDEHDTDQGPTEGQDLLPPPPPYRLGDTAC